MAYWQRCVTRHALTSKGKVVPLSDCTSVPQGEGKRGWSILTDAERAGRYHNGTLPKIRGWVPSLRPTQ